MLAEVSPRRVAPVNKVLWDLRGAPLQIGFMGVVFEVAVSTDGNLQNPPLQLQVRRIVIEMILHTTKKN